MTPEGKVKKEVKCVLDAIGCFYYMPVQNGMGIAGVSDFIACVEGKFVAIETKRGDKNVSARSMLGPAQKRFGDSVDKSGGYFFCVTSGLELTALMIMTMPLSDRGRKAVQLAGRKLKKETGDED